MLDESITLAIIPLSLGIAGIIFIGIACYLRHKYTYKGGVQTKGILLGFRKLDNEHMLGALNYAVGRGKYQDYKDNVCNSKPIIRFFIGKKMVECYYEWSVSNLGKKDIGKELPIRYFVSNGGRSCRIILDGKEYEQQRIRGRNIIFGIFAGIGSSLFVVALLAYVGFVL